MKWTKIERVAAICSIASAIFTVWQFVYPQYIEDPLEPMIDLSALPNLMLDKGDVVLHDGRPMTTRLLDKHP